jgi:hypothetical protein
MPIIRTILERLTGRRPVEVRPLPNDLFSEGKRRWERDAREKTTFIRQGWDSPAVQQRAPEVLAGQFEGLGKVALQEIGQSIGQGGARVGEGPAVSDELLEDREPGGPACPHWQLPSARVCYCPASGGMSDLTW